MEWLTVSAFGSLAAIVLWAGFLYLMSKDAEEVRQNREENCTYHRWGREAGVGLRCAVCGKHPQG